MVIWTISDDLGAYRVVYWICLEEVSNLSIVSYFAYLHNLVTRVSPDKFRPVLHGVIGDVDVTGSSISSLGGALLSQVSRHPMTALRRIPSSFLCTVDDLTPE